MAAFGPVTNNIPEKLLQIAPMMAKELNKNGWSNEMAKMTAKKPKSAAEMYDILKVDDHKFSLNEIITTFRRFFDTIRCNGASGESFVQRFMKHIDTSNHKLYWHSIFCFIW